MKTRVYVVWAFALGFSLGGLAIARRRVDIHERDQKRIQDANKIILYLAHMLNRHRVPITEFDAIVMNSIVNENPIE